MSEPTVAVALLQVFCRDEALVGDILEEYEFRRSRAWLWRQVGVAVIFSLPYGMVRPARYAPKMQMPIGGLGFVTIVALITIVAPGAWWFVAAGAMGGIALAVALVMSTRHRVMHEPMVRGHVLLPFLVLLIGVGAASRSNAQTLEPAVAVDPVDGIVDAFNTHKVVMLPGGHGSKPAHNLLMKILR
jgi:uncharacterized membrane protein